MSLADPSYQHSSVAPSSVGGLSLPTSSWRFLIYGPPISTDLHERGNPILLLPEGEGRDEGKGGVEQPESQRSRKTLLGNRTRSLPLVRNVGNDKPGAEGRGEEALCTLAQKPLQILCHLPRPFRARQGIRPKRLEIAFLLVVKQRAMQP